MKQLETNSNRTAKPVRHIKLRDRAFAEFLLAIRLVLDNEQAFDEWLAQMCICPECAALAILSTAPRKVH